MGDLDNTKLGRGHFRYYVLELCLKSNRTAVGYTCHSHVTITLVGRYCLTVCIKGLFNREVMHCNLCFQRVFYCPLFTKNGRRSLRVLEGNGRLLYRWWEKNLFIS